MHCSHFAHREGKGRGGKGDRTYRARRVVDLVSGVLASIKRGHPERALALLDKHKGEKKVKTSKAKTTKQKLHQFSGYWSRLWDINK